MQGAGAFLQQQRRTSRASTCCCVHSGSQVPRPDSLAVGSACGCCGTQDGMLARACCTAFTSLRVFAREWHAQAGCELLAWCMCQQVLLSAAATCGLGAHTLLCCCSRQCVFRPLGMGRVLVTYCSHQPVSCKEVVGVVLPCNESAIAGVFQSCPQPTTIPHSHIDPPVILALPQLLHQAFTAFLAAACQRQHTHSKHQEQGQQASRGSPQHWGADSAVLSCLCAPQPNPSLSQPSPPACP